MAKVASVVGLPPLSSSISRSLPAPGRRSGVIPVFRATPVQPKVAPPVREAEKVEQDDAAEWAEALRVAKAREAAEWAEALRLAKAREAAEAEAEEQRAWEWTIAEARERVRREEEREWQRRVQAARIVPRAKPVRAPMSLWPLESAPRSLPAPPRRVSYWP